MSYNSPPMKTLRFCRINAPFQINSNSYNEKHGKSLSEKSFTTLCTFRIGQKDYSECR